jgi:hypothetical protein
LRAFSFMTAQRCSASAFDCSMIRRRSCVASSSTSLPCMTSDGLHVRMDLSSSMLWDTMRCGPPWKLMPHARHFIRGCRFCSFSVT